MKNTSILSSFVFADETQNRDKYHSVSKTIQSANKITPKEDTDARSTDFNIVASYSF